MSTSGAAWLERFAVALGLAPPTDAECEALLSLAAVAAHASERTAAPITTWLAGRAGVALSEAQKVADSLAEVDAGTVRGPTGSEEKP